MHVQLNRSMQPVPCTCKNMHAELPKPEYVYYALPMFLEYLSKLSDPLTRRLLCTFSPPNSILICACQRNVRFACERTTMLTRAAAHGGGQVNVPRPHPRRLAPTLAPGTKICDAISAMMGREQVAQFWKLPNNAGLDFQCKLESVTDNRCE